VFHSHSNWARQCESSGGMFWKTFREKWCRKYCIHFRRNRWNRKKKDNLSSNRLKLPTEIVQRWSGGIVDTILKFFKEMDSTSPFNQWGNHVVHGLVRSMQTGTLNFRDDAKTRGCLRPVCPPFISPIRLTSETIRMKWCQKFLNIRKWASFCDEIKMNKCSEWIPVSSWYHQ
jgi:hypothetical protein